MTRAPAEIMDVSPVSVKLVAFEKSKTASLRKRATPLDVWWGWVGGG